MAAGWQAWGDDDDASNDDGDGEVWDPRVPSAASSEQQMVQFQDSVSKKPTSSYQVADIHRICGKGAAASSDDVANALVGKMQRHPITGKIHIQKGSAHPGKHDFLLVDLFRRATPAMSIADMCRDPYIFKPVLLGYRTWIWHNIYRDAVKSGQIAMTPGQGVWQALTWRCLDAGTEGMWSPVMVQAPGLIAVVLSGDYMFAFGGIILLLCQIAFALATNTAQLYVWQRPLSLPLRFVWLIVVVWKLATSGDNIVSAIGCIVLILVSLIDAWYGDFAQMGSYATRGQFEVLRVLPKQIIVCRKVNGPQGVSTSARISETITGITDGSEEESGSIVIVASVLGVLVQLMPMTKADLIPLGFEADRGPLRVVGLDLYSKQCKTCADMDPEEVTSLLTQHEIMQGIAPPSVDMDLQMSKSDLHHLTFGIRSFLAHEMKVNAAESKKFNINDWLEPPRRELVDEHEGAAAPLQSEGDKSAEHFTPKPNISNAVTVEDL